MAKKHSVLPLLLVLLQSCTVGPNFHRPKLPELPNAFAHEDNSTKVQAPTTAADDAFWQRFADPQLSGLVKAALAANPDLRTALAHYDAANALLREVRFDEIPTVTMTAQAGHQRVSKDEANDAARSHDLYGNKSSLTWELDLLGRVRRSVESQRSEVAARANELQAMQVTVVSDVANSYIDLRAAQKMLRLSRANADSQRQTLAIVQGRLDAGRSSTYDLSRTQAQLETTLSRIPQLQARIAVDRHRLAVLAGLTPTAPDAQLQQDSDMPAIPEDIEPGTPAEIIRRRPDVAAAEHRLHAATARVGVATADLFPRVSLGAALGTYAFHGGGLYAAGSESNLALLGIDWSFLVVGRVRSRIAAADAEAAAQLASYQKTVLGALEDVDNAQARFARNKEENARRLSAANDWKTAATLSNARYQAGAIELFELLDVQRSMYDAQLSQADSQARSTSSAVDLFVALAGGWPQYLPSQH